MRGKFLSRLKEDRAETLVVRIDMDERDVRMAANPETFYITDHYRGYPAMLVRLATVDSDELRELLEGAWAGVSLPSAWSRCWIRASRLRQESRADRPVGTPLSQGGGNAAEAARMAP